MLKTFIDDSGSGGDSRWVVLAGYVATADAWEQFEPEWTRVLADHPRIDCFHASEAESLRPDGPWAGVSKDERDQKIDRLIEVIHRCDLQPISVRIRQSLYNSEIKGNIPPYWDDPYIILFNILIVQFSILIPDQFPGGGRVKIVFDNHQKFRIRGPQFYDGMSSVGTISETIYPNIDYENDEDFPGLQAADLIAWQIRRAFSVPSEPRRRHYDMARSGQKGHPFFEYTLAKEEIAQYMDVWNDYASRLAVGFGLPPDARPWKNKRKE